MGKIALIHALTGSLLLAAFVVPAEAADRRAFPKGFWARTRLPSNPCQRVIDYYRIRIKVKRSATAWKRMLRFLNNEGAFFHPADCDRHPRRGSSQQRLRVWLDDPSAQRLKSFIPRVGELERWDTIQNPSRERDDNILEKWRLLSDELAQHASTLKAAPHITALVESEIRRFSPYLDFFRKTAGKLRYEIEFTE